MTYKEKIIIKYFKEYLIFSGTIDGHLNSEFYYKLNVLVGSSFIDWFIDFVKKYDLNEWNLIMHLDTLNGYFRGEENSPAYRWLTKFCRDIQLEELLENEKYVRND